MWNGVDPPRPVMENSILFFYFIFETFPNIREAFKKEARRGLFLKFDITASLNFGKAENKRDEFELASKQY